MKASLIFIILIIILLLSLSSYLYIKGQKDDDDDSVDPKGLTLLESLEKKKRDLILKLNKQTGEDLYLDFKEYFPDISTFTTLKKEYTVEELQDLKASDKFLFSNLYSKGYVNFKVFLEIFKVIAERKDLTKDIFIGFNREVVLDYACNTLNRDITDDPYLKVNLRSLNMVKLLDRVKAANQTDALTDFNQRWREFYMYTFKNLDDDVSKGDFSEIIPENPPSLNCPDLINNYDIQYMSLSILQANNQDVFIKLVNCGYIKNILTIKFLRYHDFTGDEGIDKMLELYTSIQAVYKRSLTTKDWGFLGIFDNPPVL